MTATIRPRRRARLLAACAGVLAGAVLLAGCQATPGAAATVGDTTISEQQLTADVDELVADPGSGASADDATVVTSLLGRLITMELMDQLATKNGVTVTEGQIASELTAYDQQAGGRDAVYQVFAQQGVPRSQIDAMVRLSLQATGLGPVLKPGGTGDEQTQAVVDAIVALSDDVGVDVNPRWGAWDAKTLNVSPGSDDLSSQPSGT